MMISLLAKYKVFEVILRVMEISKIKKSNPKKIAFSIMILNKILERQRQTHIGSGVGRNISANSAHT